MKAHVALEEAPRTGAAPMHLLIVDDEETTRELCVAVAHQVGLKATAVDSAEEALEVVEQSAIDIVLTDLKLPGTSGLELLKNIHEMHPQIAVIVLTQYGTIDSAIEATKTVALDYVTKPFRIEELRARLEQLHHGQPGFGKLIGLSPKMQRVYKTIDCRACCAFAGDGATLEPGMGNSAKRFGSGQVNFVSALFRPAHSC
jgi:DNA-binding NtrC family response regulator